MRGGKCFGRPLAMTHTTGISSARQASRTARSMGERKPDTTHAGRSGQVEGAKDLSPVPPDRGAKDVSPLQPTDERLRAACERLRVEPAMTRKTQYCIKRVSLTSEHSRSLMCKRSAASCLGCVIARPDPVHKAPISGRAVRTLALGSLVG